MGTSISKHKVDGGSSFLDHETFNRNISRLVHNRRMAPFYKGSESPHPDVEDHLEKDLICFLRDDRIECPICFLYFPRNFNWTKCCIKPICSTCLFKLGTVQRNVICPFCNESAFGIRYWTPEQLKTNAFSDLTAHPDTGACCDAKSIFENDEPIKRVPINAVEVQIGEYFDSLIGLEQVR